MCVFDRPTLAKPSPPAPPLPQISNAASFDFWKGHYSPLYWSDFRTADSSWATSAGGTLYKVTRGRLTTDPSYATYVSAGGVGTGVFNPANDDLVGGDGLNNNMGYWDRPTVTAPNYGDMEIGELKKNSSSRRRRRQFAARDGVLMMTTNASCARPPPLCAPRRLGASSRLRSFRPP